MPKTPLFLFSFSFILGLLFKASLDLAWPLILFLVIIVLLFLNIKGHNFLKIILAIIIFFLAFLFNFSDNVKLKEYNKLELGRKELLVWICQEPEQDFKKQTIILCPLDSNYQGKIISWWSLYPQLNYGQQFIVTGNLSKPKQFPDFDYQSFLASKNIYYSLSFPKIVKKVSGNKASSLSYFIYSIRVFIKNFVKTNLPQPNAGLILAILLGDRANMTDSLQESFKVSGINHLTAVSGTHINLISLLLLFLFFTLSFKKQTIYYWLIIILAFYVLIIGFRPSALRAFLMSSLALIAWRFQRLVHPLSILSFCAAITLLINHRSLLDIGWQLSFMAVLGILLFLPYFNNFSNKLLKLVPSFSRRFFQFIFLTFFLSLSVQIMIWPILAWHFQKFSLLSLFTNVLVFPVFSLLMFTLFPILIFAMIFPFLSFWLFSPIYYLSSLIIKIAQVLSNYSSLYIEIVNLNYFHLLLYYLFLLIVYNSIKKLSQRT